MERSLFGLFTAFLCFIFLLGGAQACRTKRYGLAILLWVNASTHHAFYMTLF